MIRYMLDRNTCIGLIKQRPEKISARLLGLDVEDVAISSIKSVDTLDRLGERTLLSRKGAKSAKKK